MFSCLVIGGSCEVSTFDLHLSFRDSWLNFGGENFWTQMIKTLNNFWFKLHVCSSSFQGLWQLIKHSKGNKISMTHLSLESAISAAVQHYHHMPTRASCDSCHVPSLLACPMALASTAAQKRCPVKDPRRTLQRAVDRCYEPREARGRVVKCAACRDFDWHIYPYCNEAFLGDALPLGHLSVWVNRPSVLSLHQEVD